jgi:LAO/AO transport system ATPase
LAVARAITAIENATAVGAELSLAVRGRRAKCRTLGVTGPPGAGKSSLISALIPILLEKHPRIGVLTVDPSSPVSGGAVLGDRVRMAAHSNNPAVFIRSLAARGHLGGVTRTTRGVIDVLGTAGFDLVIVETVGTGQSEVEVAVLTDVKLGSGLTTATR